MKKYRTMVMLMLAVCYSLAAVGCKSGGKTDSSEHPSSVQQKSEHPKGEHPKGEHPKGEHPD